MPWWLFENAGKGRLALGPNVTKGWLAVQDWARRKRTAVSGIMLRLGKGSQWACKIKHVKLGMQSKENVNGFLVSNS